MNVPRELVEAMLSTDPLKGWGLKKMADELDAYGHFGMSETLKGYISQLEVLSQEETENVPAA